MASTLEEVARIAGVSRASVSRVVNGKPGVAPHIVEAVTAAVAATGYVPNRAARTLVTGRTGTVLVVVSGADSSLRQWGLGEVLADPFFARVAGGLMGSLRPRNIDPVLMLAVSEPERERVVNYVREGNADGVLLVSAEASDPLPGMLTRAKIPVVLFSRPSEPAPISYVDVDNHEGAALAARHLVARGCRRLGIITGPVEVAGAEDRLEGFLAAARRLSMDDVATAAGTFSVDSGAHAMIQLLAQGVDGVFASNDNMAVGAILAAHEQGLEVPGDVAVVGYDDTIAALMCRPTVTTIRQPIEAIAAEMARLLLDVIDDPGMPARHEVLAPELIVRGSA
ncbi:LacI family transcriptional regulator [Protaetiibacter larvae]|uniref:LacI family transcriptional regulator n=1 Tax=Protaetiibacter larvae TaxID=2592654 RepID=A0A5C1YD62_9MICO|nr:LacI family transcriptional regulator [Protaetiibacter larvae]